MTHTTTDGLLDRRVTIEQPIEGFRVAVDTVLLAAAVPAEAGQSVLDMGCGVGGAMLCLACRMPGLVVTGVEIQPELAELCRRNIERNAFKAEMNALARDVLDLPENLAGVDHVMMNPPYHDEARHDASAHAGKRAANTEKTGDLALWFSAAARALKPSGMLTLIHRADRLEEIQALMDGLFGDLSILPVVPKAGAAPKRVLVRALKDSGKSAQFCQNLVLHKEDGGYTPEAEAVLRHMEPVKFIHE